MACVQRKFCGTGYLLIIWLKQGVFWPSQAVFATLPSNATGGNYFTSGSIKLSSELGWAIVASISATVRGAVLDRFS